MSDDVSVGRVISRGFGVITDNPVNVLGIAFLLGGVPLVGFALFMQSAITGEMSPDQMDPDQMIGSLALVFGSMLVSIIFQAIVQGSLVRASIAHAAGERASFGESIGAGLTVMLPLVGLSIIMALGVGIGFLFLFVPGVILYVLWSVAAPVLVAERTGVFEALGRSRDLTRGARWQVFGVLVILFVSILIFSEIYGAALLAMTGIDQDSLAGMARQGVPVGWLIAEGLVTTITVTVWSTVTTSLYIELRNWKEGPADNALKDIFS